MTMLNRFAKGARVAVEDAVDVARELGSPTVEAEHLLLAVAREDDPAARALAEHRLDFGGLHAALERETERSLAAVGVAAEPGSFSPWVARPRFGTSAKLGLERALRTAVARGDREIGSAHLALGVLKAELGTVPRALQIAGVDRRALADALRATLPQ
jgi:ATP-dependent Clp protease ATP-binding subunit ClpA